MTLENIHHRCTSQTVPTRLWIDPPFLETIKPMVSRKESPESTQAVAERLRLTREAFHMKKAAWCRFVGISPQAWGNVEGTKTAPAINRIGLEQALKVCKATGVGLNWIFRGQRDDVPMKVHMELLKLESEAGVTSPARRKSTG